MIVHINIKQCFSSKFVIKVSNYMNKINVHTEFLSSQAGMATS